MEANNIFILEKVSIRYQVSILIDTKVWTLITVHTHPSKEDNCVIFHLFVLQKIWMNFKLFVIGVSEDLDEFKTLKCVFVPTNYLRKRRKLSKHEVPIGTNSIFTIVVRRHREVKRSTRLSFDSVMIYDSKHNFFLIIITHTFFEVSQ